MSASTEERGAGVEDRRPPRWTTVFLTGLVLWAASAAVAWFSEDIKLLPAVIILGSFLVPVTFLYWAFTEKATDYLTQGTVVVAFLVGGILGLLPAAWLETELLHGGYPFGQYLAVGLIEEAMKFLALWLIARGVAHYLRLDGMILGAAVGFGFAAFETAGYSLNALVSTPDIGYADNLNVPAMLESEVLRAVLAPFGHSLWTGLLGGALFAAAARNDSRLRINGEVAWTFVGVVLLHAIWDCARPFAAFITWRLTEGEWSLVEASDSYIRNPTPTQYHLYGTFQWVVLLTVTGIGLLWVRNRWRQGRAEEALDLAAAR